MRKSVAKEKIASRWERVMQPNYGTPAISLVKGKGLEVFDSEGKRYLDLLGGIATNLLGHNHPKVTAAISSQARLLSHISNFYSHEPALELAERLQEMVGDESARVFFCNSGAEANEAALKLSRTTGRTRIIAATGSFHGRTMGALSLTGQPSKRDPFRPLLRGVTHIKYGDFKALRKVNSRTAMLILEPIMGEAGVIVPPAGYLAAARAACDRAGAILALDCVQSGMGRTGTWFGYESEGIKPDLITIAKGIGGGLPLGAMIALGRYSTALGAGSHGTTFGGNPISCAAANAVINEIDRLGMMKTNLAKGALLRRLIEPIDGIGEVRGRGLLLGIGFVEPIARSVAGELLNRGFIVNAANDSTIRLAPSYLITEPQIKSFVRGLSDSCKQVSLKVQNG